MAIGEDGLARVATIKMHNKILKRPITKLCPLEDVEEDTSRRRDVASNER